MYTIIAYKPESSEICRGHVTQRYDSGIKIGIGLTEAALIDEWSRINLYNALDLDHQEKGYGILIIKHDEQSNKIIFDNNGIDTELYEDWNERQLLRKIRYANIDDDDEITRIEEAVLAFSRKRINVEKERRKRVREKYNREIKEKENKEKLREYNLLKKELEQKGLIK